MSRPPARGLAWTALALLPFAAVCALYLDYVPIWDARIYADCIEQAARGSFPADYSCASHPTIAYVFVTALLSHFVQGRYWPLLVMNAALGLSALWAFREVARALFPGEEGEANLLALCLGALPVFLSGAIDVNPDFGLACFFLWLVASLLRGRRWLAAASALCLTFSKEPGVLLALSAIGLHALCFALRRGQAWRERRTALAFYLPSLSCVPLLALWFATRPRAANGSVLWQGVSPWAIAGSFVTINLHDPTPLLVLSLQFAWVLTLLVAARLAVELVRALSRKGPPKARALVFLDALFFAVLYVETRVRTFSNVRYYLPLYPLLLLCACAALRGARPRLRALSLLALSGFFLLSSFRAVDPLSKLAVPTFHFGEHELFALGIYDPCCGLGRDQLAYNLEHAQFHYLQNEIYKDVAPGQTRGLAAARYADWYFMGHLDPRTFARTLSDEGQGLMQAKLLRPRDVAEGRRPLELFYLRLPNFPLDHAPDDAFLRRYYTPVGEKTYERHGYSIEVASYRLRRP